jgi:hypothetical protein
VGSLVFDPKISQQIVIHAFRLMVNFGKAAKKSQKKTLVNRSYFCAVM